MVKSLRKLLTNRIFISGIAVLIQFIFLWITLITITKNHPLLYQLFYTISIAMVIWLARKEDNPAYKISWIILIAAIPLLGGLFYLIWGNTPLNRSRLKKLKFLNKKELKLDLFEAKPIESSEVDENYVKLAKYVDTIGGFPMFDGANCEYFKVGEEFFESLLENLKSAEKYIFLEYFIIEHGHMWDSILEILKEKAKNGVDVRVMYDDAGCLGTLPSKYHLKLESYGIKAVRFNPFSPTLHTYLNYRSHRKICVIDGKKGYVGGLNLADEYINKVVRFGHWKDNAILMEGDCISGLVMMFLELWEYSTGTKEENYSNFISHEKKEKIGFIQPFSDSPLDDNNVCENVYLHIINSAKKYVYITTPYLILDNEMVSALILAAQSGIDVKIITPHIPDKKLVHAVTRSFYPQLIRGGVEIYEYTPGFMHGKTIISDDKIGVIGTINMDFRSFYMHFECGSILYDSNILPDIKNDFFDSLAISEKMTNYDLRKRKRIKNFMDSLLRLLAPMM